MKQTVITSTWIDSPKWVDGWPILQGASASIKPSVWLIDPQNVHSLLNDNYENTLSKSEQSKASRFIQLPHQIRYKVTHMVLRTLLAQPMQIDAATISFVNGHHNKPELSANLQAPAFNISYTEGRSIVGLGNEAAIGVDIEWLHRPMAIEDMLQTCFSPHEINYITARPEAMRTRFFTLWTRKEAILKLTGEGIGEHLPLFEVLDGECVAEKLIIGGHPPDRIFLHSFHLGDGYIGCYASSTPLTALTIYKL